MNKTTVISNDVKCLETLEIIDELLADALQMFEEGEQYQLGCAPISNKNAIEYTIGCVLEVHKTSDEQDESDNDVAKPIEPAEGPSLDRIVSDGKGFCEQLERALIWNVDGVESDRALEVNKRTELLLATMSKHIVAGRWQKQQNITDVFSKTE